MVDSQVLTQLRMQLRSDKKCFTGKEFISKVTEIGRRALVDSFDMDGPGSSNNTHVLSPTGQPIEYNEEYALKVAQYLLDEGILIHVSQVPIVSDGSSILLTPEQPTDEDDPTTSYDRSQRERTDSMRPLGVNSAMSFASGVSDAISAVDSPTRQGRQSAASAGGRGASRVSQERYSSAHSTQITGSHHYQYGQARNTPSGSRHHQRLDRPSFMGASNIYYKFAGSEDAESPLFQNQVLVSSIHLSSRSALSAAAASPNQASQISSRGGTQEENSDFTDAKNGTLCLVHDLLTQRARKERVAKQFLSSPRVQEQRRQAGNVHCNLIFKM